MESFTTLTGPAAHLPRANVDTDIIIRIERLTEKARNELGPFAFEEGAVARELDLTPSSLTKWVSQARADRSHGKTGLTTAEREELARLRKENRILQEERDILKKATAFFAKQSR